MPPSVICCHPAKKAGYCNGCHNLRAYTKTALLIALILQGTLRFTMLASCTSGVCQVLGRERATDSLKETAGSISHCCWKRPSMKCPWFFAMPKKCEVCTAWKIKATTTCESGYATVCSLFFRSSFAKVGLPSGSGLGYLISNIGAKNQPLLSTAVWSMW